MLRTGVMRFRKLKSERGMVLPIALGILSVLSISAVVVLDSSSTNARSSTRSKGDKVAFALAEAGINNAVAVLSKTGNDNMHQTLLPRLQVRQQLDGRVDLEAERRRHPGDEVRRRRRRAGAPRSTPAPRSGP